MVRTHIHTQTFKKGARERNARCSSRRRRKGRSRGVFHAARRGEGNKFTSGYFCRKFDAGAVLEAKSRRRETERSMARDSLCINRATLGCSGVDQAQGCVGGAHRRINGTIRTTRIAALQSAPLTDHRIAKKKKTITNKSGTRVKRDCARRAVYCARGIELQRQLRRRRRRRGYIVVNGPRHPFHRASCCCCNSG
ncbi:unnamed protein product [Trichogramma brassicae]|uniref:Uncharacterized protein n=1 Tax=Trichogramma brassicae TaxID=86971 RepID=A0A6H5IP00_9HYME|nr:unnamed protein product [Trichogramma brassicae]